MKKRIIIIKIALIASLISVLLMWPIVIFNNSDTWLLFQKDVSLPKQEVKLYNQIIESFLKNDLKELDFLTQKESLHLQDVKILLIRCNMLFWFSLITFILTYLVLGRSGRNIIKRISTLVLLFLILFVLVSIFSFNWLFLKFHETFVVSNYSFASNSMLKILYPDSFFRNVFICYFLLSIVGCLAVIATSYKLKK